jgi:hypothetical protein
VFPEVQCLTTCPPKTDPLDVACGWPENGESNICHDHVFDPAGKSSRAPLFHSELNRGVFMPARKYLLSFSFIGVLSFFIGCGGSSSRPTPRGGFTAANFSGSYAFLVSGNDVNGFFGIAGSLQADGAGHISSGVMDINQNNSNGAPQPVTNQSFTGTYSVQADGRGIATLTSTAGNFRLAFIIISAQRALITRFDPNGTGSGTMDLQTSSAFSTTALAGDFAFNLSGVDGVGAPFASVGSVTTDNTGAVTTGVVDSADNGSISTAVPVTSGALAVGANGRSTLDITTAAGTVSFAAYVVDANHLKLVETDTTTGAQLAGEAFRQPGGLSNASLAGPFAFTVAGVDATRGLPFAAGGVLNADGAGTVTSGTEDFSELNFNPAIGLGILNTSTYSISGVRGTLNLQTSDGSTTSFAIYPTVNGVQVIETDAGTVGTGSAFGQTGPFTNGSISGAYGLNFTAVTGTQVDSTASLNADGAGTLKGIIDINELNTSGFPAPGSTLSGTYSLNSDGRGSFDLTSGLGTQTMAVYVVNSSRALFIEVDGGVVSVGSIEHQ